MLVSVMGAQWKQAGHALLKCKDSVNFWIGDWINYGIAEYGDKYATALEVFKAEGSAGYGLDEGTLRNIASIASRVDLSRRRDNLSFTHHEAVAHLPAREQDHWLAMAAMNSFSVSELRAEIRGKLKSKTATATNSDANVFIFDGWINEAERGFKSFPPTKWDDDELARRIKLIKAIEQPLIEEAKRRNIIPIDV